MQLHIRMRENIPPLDKSSVIKRIDQPQRDDVGSIEVVSKMRFCLSSYKNRKRPWELMFAHMYAYFWIVLVGLDLDAEHQRMLMKLTGTSLPQ